MWRFRDLVMPPSLVTRLDLQTMPVSRRAVGEDEIPYGVPSEDELRAYPLAQKFIWRSPHWEFSTLKTFVPISRRTGRTPNRFRGKR